MLRSKNRRNQANRQNAQKSTGPKTTEGKNRSRWNALTHGLLAQSVVLPDCEELESPEQFRELLTDLTDDLKPVGIREGMLVEQIAVCYWRLRRALRMEAGNIVQRVDFHHRFDEQHPIGCESLPGHDTTHLIIRYETAIDRRLTRAQNTLERLQSARKAKKPNEPNSPQPQVSPHDTGITKRPGSRLSQIEEWGALGGEPNSPQPVVPEFDITDKYLTPFDYEQQLRSQNNKGETVY